MVRTNFNPDFCNKIGHEPTLCVGHFLILISSIIDGEPAESPWFMSVNRLRLPSHDPMLTA